MENRIVALPFTWDKGCLNDHGTRILKNAGVQFCYIMQKLNSKSGSHWYPVEYRDTGLRNGDNPIWEIVFRF